MHNKNTQNSNSKTGIYKSAVRLLQRDNGVMDWMWKFAITVLIGSKIEKPRPGFEPGACCLRGSRSTELSYRGVYLL